MLSVSQQNFWMGTGAFSLCPSSVALFPFPYNLSTSFSGCLNPMCILGPSQMLPSYLCVFPGHPRWKSLLLLLTFCDILFYHPLGTSPFSLYVVLKLFLGMSYCPNWNCMLFESRACDEQVFASLTVLNTVPCMWLTLNKKFWKKFRS